MLIIKFGGSSISSPSRITNVINIVKEKYERSPQLAVVVSAFGGVTDDLILMSHQAAKGNPLYLAILQNFQERHHTAVEHLLPTSHHAPVIAKLQQEFKDLSDALHGVFLVKEISQRTQDFITSFGERLSAYIISEAMKITLPQTIYLDARDLIKTDRNFGQAHIDYEKTNALIAQRFAKWDFLPIITGFIGSSVQGETTTLGRGGSDFTAAIFGAALHVQEIEIWTDVDGVMTADPRKVKQAFPIPKMTFKEALEMSHFGAKVLHPPTVTPAMQGNIPIRIKNTFHPEATGTFISHQVDDHGSSSICGISSIDSIALLRLEGNGIVGVCGIATRLFSALSKHEINVILISQGSSEHSICFAVMPQHAQLAKEALEKEFSLEQKAGLVDPIIVEKNLSILAAVGENMRHTPGISGRLFGALGKNGINIVAIAQGSSEYNISIVIKQEDEIKALNVIHEDFFLSHVKAPNVLSVSITKSTLKEIRVFAPATVANVACGFDIFGFALETPGDEVTVTLTDRPGVRLTSISGDQGKLPLDVNKNTAGVSVIKLLAHLNSQQGCDIALHKKMPLGSGLGSSAASSVGSLFAVNHLLGKPLSEKELIPFAMEGERLACGSAHADNVAPALMGGFVLIRSYAPLDVIQIPCSLKLFCTILHPHMEIHTEDARKILNPQITMQQHIAQSGNAVGLAIALMQGKPDLLQRSLHDVIAEPKRSTLIPGFDAMKAAALHAGALGCSISGSGPSLFALSLSLETANKVGQAMAKACAEHGMASDQYISKINETGPRILP